MRIILALSQRGTYGFLVEILLTFQVDFEELMAGDIYSTSLLFWEIVNRVHDASYTLALSPEISGKFLVLQ